MTGDDQRYRIACHCLADITSGFGTFAEFHGNRAIGGRAAPADTAGSRIDVLEEIVLAVEIELEPGEINLFAAKIPFPRRERRLDFAARRSPLRLREPAQHQPFRRVATFRWQLKADDAAIAPCD